MNVADQCRLSTDTLKSISDGILGGASHSTTVSETYVASTSWSPKRHREPGRKCSPVTLMEALDEKGIPYESLIKREEGHGFTLYENNVELYTRMQAFFKEHLAK